MRRQALAEIGKAIEEFGHYVYIVQQRVVPRFAYSIGLSVPSSVSDRNSARPSSNGGKPCAGKENYGLAADVGFELAIPGASYYMASDIVEIVNKAGSVLRSDQEARALHVKGLGEFMLQEMHESWSDLLLLGANDYYGRKVRALQILPGRERTTIDVPDCSRPWSEEVEPIWQWLRRDWQYEVPEDSVAVTDLNTLRGSPVVEAARWEADEWELFSGQGDRFSRDEIRIVPLSTLLAFDGSLLPVTKLAIGEAAYRPTRGAEWLNWHAPSSTT